MWPHRHPSTRDARERPSPAQAELRGRLRRRARGGRGRRHRRTRGSLRSHRENAARRLVGTLRQVRCWRRSASPRSPTPPSPPVAPPPPSRRVHHKRCRMCGNNVRVTACTSCCLPLVDRASWVPARVPRPGAASDSGDSGDSSDDDGRRTRTSTPARPPSSPRRLRRAIRLGTSPTRDDGLRPWWLPRLGPNPARPPSRPPGRDPALAFRIFASSAWPRERVEATVRAAYRDAALNATLRMLPPLAGSRGRSAKRGRRQAEDRPGAHARAPPRSDAASLDHRTPVRTPGPDPATRTDTRTTETTTCSCR